MVTAVNRRTASRSAASPKRVAPQRNYLAEVTTNARSRPTAAVVYGPPGVGKTSFGASMPDPLFLTDDQEDGLNTLKSSKRIANETPMLPPAASWTDVLGALEALAVGDHDYKTLVVDTLGGMERLCHAHVCERDFNGQWGDQGFASYNKGYEVALPEWRMFLNALDRLRNERNMAIVCLAHSQIRSYHNPEGEDYDRFLPDLHNKTWAVTHRWADMVLFCNYQTQTVKEGSHAKGQGGQQRRMYTEYHPAYEAKNRHGLPLEIDMGKTGKEAWKRLKQALASARKGE